MATLYLMRHGQTEFNVRKLVQGHCDAPLTELGVEQARRAAAWYRAHGVTPARLASSPLGRAHRTLDIVIEENPGFAALPRTDEDGLMERCYGIYEGRPMSEFPVNPWEPGDALVAEGGDSEESARARMVGALRRLMAEADGGDVLAVAHGSIITLFKTTMAAYARCEQDVKLANCCILTFAYDSATGIFANTQIVNVAEPGALEGAAQPRA